MKVDRVGPFELEECIGSGAMGTVFRARHVTTNQPVALKIFEGHNLSRIRSEAALLAALSHSAIVPYVCHGEEGGRRYLAMDWLQGPTLAQELERGPLSLAGTLQLGRRLASALSHAHGRGVVHLDVKPANVLLVAGAAERAVLVDFGIASSAEHTRNLGGAGTPGYMAPEQTASGAHVGPQADVFSLGCLLFECLAGSAVWQADDTLVRHHRACSEPMPQLVRPSGEPVPPQLLALLERMLAKLPSERPSPAAVQRELDALAAPQSSVSPPARQPTAKAALPASPPRTTLPLVGRDVELRLVLSLFEATVEDRAPKLGLLEAPAGAGKSRLLLEAIKQIAASEPQPTVWHIQADSVLGNTPRALVRTLIRAALSDPPAVPSRTIGDRHDAELLQLAHQLGLDSSGASLRTARFVGALAGLIAQADEIELSDLRARGDLYDRELAREFERWLSIVAQAAPLVLILEDLHCADEASLQLIVSTVSRLHQSRITVIGSARPEASVVEPLRAAGAQRIGLSPLTRRAALRLAQALPSLDEATVTRLWEKSGGSPLFLEELFRQADARDSDLPSSLSAAVEEDLALLSSEAANLARLASMLGNQVQLADLMALVSGRDQLSVETALDELHRRDVLRPRLSSTSAAGQLTFRHPLWRELTEATLSLRELADTRHQIVSLWSERDPASAARQAELEAETWGKLEHAANQREAWAQAGLLWQAAGDLERTIDAFDKAMLGSGGRWLVALAQAVAVVRRSPPGLVERIEVELERSQQELDGLSWVGAARCFAALSRGSAAKDCLDRALAAEAALASGEEQRVLRQRRLAASVEVGTRRGAFAEAAAAYRELARGDERIDLRTRALASLALAASGSPAEGEQVLRETALLPEAEERSVKADISKHLLLTKLFAKDYAGAVPVADQAIADARLARLPFHESVALHNFGDVLHRLGRYADSRAALRASQELAETHQFEALLRANRSHLRYLDGLEGDAQAVLALEHEIADAEARGALGDAVDLRCLIARAFHKHGQLERAAIEYEAVLRLSSSTGQKLAHEEAESALAQLQNAANVTDGTQPEPAG